MTVLITTFGDEAVSRSTAVNRVIALTSQSFQSAFDRFRGLPEAEYGGDHDPLSVYSVEDPMLKSPYQESSKVP